eukprot:6155185-Amphidinium_carterae.2
MRDLWILNSHSPIRGSERATRHEYGFLLGIETCFVDVWNHTCGHLVMSVPQRSKFSSDS